MTRRSPSSVKVTASGVRPWFAICFATRCSRAILSFSSSVYPGSSSTSMRSRSGGGIGVEHVGRGDEQHLRQIERHVQVVIAERVVLLRIQHLEQRRAGIAAEIGAQLVDLVEDEHRVLRLRAAQPLDDLPRQRADVGPAMAADLGLVAHAAERHAHELPLERAARSTCASDVLPTPGGPTKQRIGPFIVGFSLRTARYSRMRSFAFSRPE